MLTVPASFDEEARELTRRAAIEAGLERLTLLEEPQAAFYAWLESQGDAWRERVRVGDLVLVCDVGGGTTDFSLIAVSEEAGDLVLERVAVGDHILLGGDNMDLALARLLQQRLEAAGHRIDSWQLQALWYQCRAAKERLFEDAGVATQEVVIRGRGTKLVGGTLRTELRREDLEQVLVDGFFPVVGVRRPTRRASGASGSRSWACPTPPMPPSPATSRGSSADSSSLRRARAECRRFRDRRRRRGRAAGWRVPRTSSSTAA